MKLSTEIYPEGMADPVSPPIIDKVNIHLRLSRAMLAEIQREMIRTGHTRTALLKIAWQEYMRNHPPPKGKR